MSLLQDLQGFTMLDFLRYSTIPRVRFMEPVHGRSECSVNLDPKCRSERKAIGMKVNRTMRQKKYIYLYMIIL